MKKTTSRAPVFLRRTFLERLGLGVGAAILSPIAQTLVKEARGQTSTRKIAVFVLHAHGMNYDFSFTPPEFKRPDDKAHTWAVLDGPKNYTWPGMLKTLERHRSRMLLLDGLANQPRSGVSGHSAGYSALSCFAAPNGAANDGGGLPGGVTIDQFIGQKIGMSTRRRSVLFGASKHRDAQIARIFAGARGKPEPHFQSPALLFNDLFGTIVTDASGVNRGAAKQRVLLDTMRADIKRLQGAFAGAERQKLDHYLGAIEDFERREKAAAGITCKVPFAAPGTAGAPPTTTVEDRLESMNEMAILALACGLTNVVGISVGTGNSHNNFPDFGRIGKGTPWEKVFAAGHDIGHQVPAVQGPVMDLIHNFNGGLIARMLEALAKIEVGDATLADNSVMLYTSDNAEEHHATHRRWPAVLIGTAGGKIRADGRFIRYPRKGTTGSRSMADLFCTIATAVGAPTNEFGKGGNEPVQGPLELLS